MSMQLAFRGTQFEDKLTHRLSYPFCGSVVPLKWTSDSGEVEVIFISDSSYAEKGFNLTYDLVIGNSTNITLPCYGHQCDNGSLCLSNYKVCDIQPDCEDMTDEYNCTFETTTMYDVNTDDTITTDASSSSTSGAVCAQDHFQCNNSDCIHIYDICDTQVDCPDGSDEGPHCIHNGFTPTDVFEDGWFVNFLDISGNLDLYEEFRSHYYIENRFERVKGNNPPDWESFMTFSSTPDFSDIENVLKLSPDEVLEYGHQLEDFILQCTFDGQPCNISEDFYTFQDERYGNCFKFNHGRSGMPVLQSTRTGNTFGLKLTLYMDQSEYISLYGRDVGARVTIFPHDVPVFPKSEGFTIKSGTVTSLGLREFVISRLSEPYGTCFGDKNSKQGEETRFSKDYRYKVDACESECLESAIVSKCGCEQILRVGDIPPCNILNKTQDMCIQLMNFMFQKNALKCNCPQICWDKYYDISSSQSVWPSHVYLRHLLRSIQATNSKTRNLNDLDSVRLNLARLEVYFEELNSQTISEQPAYPIEQLFSDIGGTLGLYIGLSIITVFEFFEFMTDVIGFFISRIQARRIKKKRQER
ncbi:degenerin mec-10-like [Glandiceps talaboti]